MKPLLLMVSMLIAACGTVEDEEECVEDWVVSEIRDSYLGAPCPPQVKMEEIGCRYIDICGEEIWVSGCTVGGVMCPDDRVYLPKVGEPVVRIGQ